MPGSSGEQRRFPRRKFCFRVEEVSPSMSRALLPSTRRERRPVHPRSRKQEPGPAPGFATSAGEGSEGVGIATPTRGWVGELEGKRR